MQQTETYKKSEDSFQRPGLHILSMGAGVQTTAMLLRYGRRMHHVIFADVGDEHPPTYEYIEKYLKPYCKEIGLPWHTVRNPKFASLMDKCLERHIMPVRTQRWCTHDFKISPILRKLKELGATRKVPANVHIGISIDESHRVSSDAWVDKPRYQHKCYPFIENRISRRDCYQIIEDHGWPVPPKSGCDFCPFAKRSEIRQVASYDPRRYAQIVKMEQQAMAKDKLHMRSLLGGSPLTLNHTLGEYNGEEEEEEEPERTCDSGHCFL